MWLEVEHHELCQDEVIIIITCHVNTEVLEVMVRWVGHMSQVP